MHRPGYRVRPHTWAGGVSRGTRAPGDDPYYSQTRRVCHVRGPRPSEVRTRDSESHGPRPTVSTSQSRAARPNGPACGGGRVSSLPGVEGAGLPDSVLDGDPPRTSRKGRQSTPPQTPSRGKRRATCVPDPPSWTRGTDGQWVVTGTDSKFTGGKRGRVGTPTPAQRETLLACRTYTPG